MKTNLDKILLMILALVFCHGLLQAQQKSSQKPFAAEIKKIEKKQDERKQMLQQTQQDGMQNTRQTPVQTNQQPTNNKPSSLPMRKPTVKKNG